MSGEERAARALVATALRREAAAQQAGDLQAIGACVEELEMRVRALRLDAPELERAFTFWDWWIDARNHDWRYHEGIARDDWPRLARHVADTVESGAPPSDPVLLRYLEQLTRPGPLARLVRWLGAMRPENEGST